MIDQMNPMRGGSEFVENAVVQLKLLFSFGHSKNCHLYGK